MSDTKISRYLKPFNKGDKLTLHKFNVDSLICFIFSSVFI